MKKINNVFVNGEIIDLKKGMFGYRVVHPIKDEKGNIIWINLLVGGWGNFWILIFIMLVILSFMYGVKEMMASCNDMADNPQDYFGKDCMSETKMTGTGFIISGFEEGDIYGELKT